MPRPSPKNDSSEPLKSQIVTHSRSNSGIASSIVNISCFNFNTQVLIREMIISDSTQAPRAHLRCKSGEAAVFTPYTKEPFEFCFDPESAFSTPDSLLPKFSHASGLEVQFIIDSLTMDISGNKDGEDWFFLHVASDSEVISAVQNLNKDSSYYVKLDNIYPVRPEACAKNSKYHNLTQAKNTLSWSWRWTPILGAPTILGGFKNVCVFIKRAGTEFHVIAEFKFWTPLPSSSRKASLTSLQGLGHKSNWFSCTYPPLAHVSSNSQVDHEMILDDLVSKARARQGSFESDTGGALSGLEFEEDDDSFTTAQGYSGGAEAIFPQSALAEISFGSDYVFRDEDGPVFRATLQHLEKRVHSFKHDIKRLLKLGLEAMESRKESIRHERALIDAVLAFPSIQPLAAAYFNQATQYLRQNEDASIQLIPQLILDPLRRLYDTDIKAAESRKKQFDQVSDEYYSYLSKYLSAKKDRGRKGNFSDSKYQERRRHFELCRFNYYIYIHELRGGVKDQEILSNLTIYAEKHLSGLGQLHDALLLLKPGLDQITLRVSEAERELALQRKDLDEKRRHIIKPEHEFGDNLLEHSSEVSSNAPAVLRNKFLGIRDLQTTNRETSLAVGRKREGFLFTSSRTTAKFDKTLPGQGSWHKKWCVLSGGCLHEYNNWKKQLEVNFEPVPLQFATVRVAFQTSRKFCFEVITPKLRRQYQATSDDDMMGWITCIANAIESLWIGTSSCDDLRKQASLQHQPTPSPLGSLDQQYLLKLLQADSSNHACADCDAPGPEWCSINFGILLCIECSGIHRSLGTHITKVRSLALDVVTFTPDLIGLLQRLGNQTANAFWEANMEEGRFHVDDAGSKWTKPTSSDERAFKLRFITAKYVEHKFLLSAIPAPPLDGHLVQALQANLLAPTPLTASIFAGVLQDQLMGTLQPTLLGGDVDGLLEVSQPSPLVKIFGLHALVTPLHIALFCLEQTDPETRVPYCMAELLIQNGANVNVQVEGTAPTLLHFAALHNDLAAIQYLLLKGASPTVPQDNHEAWPCFLVTDLACQQLLLEVTFTEAQKMNFDSNLLKLIAPPLPPRGKHFDEDDDHASSPVFPDNESASLMPGIGDESAVPDASTDMGRSISADTRNLASPLKRLSGGWKQQLKDSSRDNSLASGFSSSFVIPKKNTFRRSAQLPSTHDYSRSEDSTPGATLRARPAINDSETSLPRHRRTPSQSSFRNFPPAPASSASSSPSPPKAFTEPILVDYPTPSSTSFASTPSRLPSRTPFTVTDHDSSYPGDFLSRRISKPNRATSIIEAFRKMSK